MTAHCRSVDGKIVVVARDDDLHAAAAATSLQRRHGCDTVIIDTSTVTSTPCAVRLSGTEHRRNFGDVTLEDVAAVWWRRPQPVVPPPGNNPDFDEYRRVECEAFVRGLTWSTPARWVNNPGHERLASSKIVQLRAAADAGLSVPETLITNDPAQAEAFIASRSGRVIFKRTGVSRDLSLTQLIDHDTIRHLPTITVSPTTFQDFVEPRADLRIVWMGTSGIAVHIDSASGAGRVDSRIDNSVDFSPFALPDHVHSGLRRMMAALGLAFGVIDMRWGVDGRFWFLEVNPQGQFAYLEILSGEPIFDPLSDYLLHGTSPREVDQRRRVFA